MSFILISCNGNGVKKDTNDVSNKTENNPLTDENVLKEEEERGEWSFSQPPTGMQREYASVEEFISAFDQLSMTDPAMIDKETNEELYREVKALACFAEKTQSFMIPKYNGEELIDEDRGYNNRAPGLRMKTNNQFGLAEVWYYPDFGVITTEVLKGDYLKVYKEDGLKALLNVKYPAIFSEESKADLTNTETELTFGDETVPVVMTKYNTSDRLHIRFVVGGDTYVTIQAYLFIDDYRNGALDGLSFERVTLPLFPEEIMEKVSRRSE
jgi:hypothetical protein